MGAPYASKGVAGTGLGLGIAGTALGLLNNSNCGNGVLGGLFGNNCDKPNYVSQLQAENAQLRAENYSDKVGKEVYMQSLNDNRNLRDEMYAFIKPLSDEAANNKVNIAVLQEQQKCAQEKAELREQIIIGKINEVALATNGRFDALNNTISCLAGDVARNTARLNNITNEIVPLCKICPQPMQRFNSFTAPTALAPDCQSVTGCEA
ncbi:hypothetical protein E5G42_02100 [Campylobacter jejuni]|nr:hypothetical protein [Campylobacter jejuni]